MEYASIEREIHVEVTFELVPSGSGTLLRLTETGFRERGWGSGAGTVSSGGTS